MKLSKQTENGIVVCKIEGEINIDNSYEMRKAFDEIISDKTKKVIIDLSTLLYIDSSGLATLIEMFQRLKKIDGELRLCCLNDKVKSVFEITKLNTLFSIHENLDSAKEGF